MRTESLNKKPIVVLPEHEIAAIIGFIRMGIAWQELYFEATDLLGRTPKMDGLEILYKKYKLNNQ